MTKYLKKNINCRGFMRSDKTLATCQLKLAPLDTMCSLKSMEKVVIQVTST